MAELLTVGSDLRRPPKTEKTCPNASWGSAGSSSRWCSPKPTSHQRGTPSWTLRGSGPSASGAHSALPC